MKLFFNNVLECTLLWLLIHIWNLLHYPKFPKCTMKDKCFFFHQSGCHTVYFSLRSPQKSRINVLINCFEYLKLIDRIWTTSSDVSYWYWVSHEAAQSARISSVMAHKNAPTVTIVSSNSSLHPFFNEILMSLWTHYCVGSQSNNILLAVHESSQQ